MKTKYLMADELVSRILFGVALASRSATIIPLVPASQPGSSDLPEGPSSNATCNHLGGTASEGVALSSTLNEPGRLSPPIWSCTTRGFPCLRHCWRSGGLLPHRFTLTFVAFHWKMSQRFFLWYITGNRHAGGLFSVALSVNSSTGLSLCSFAV